MDKPKAINLIKIYGEAWMERDAEKILQVFTPDATYFDPREGEQVGHEGIKAYWESKVIGSQKDIKFQTEVAIFGVKDEKFSSLREYYRSEKVPL